MMEIISEALILIAASTIIKGVTIHPFRGIRQERLSLVRLDPLQVGYVQKIMNCNR